MSILKKLSDTIKAFSTRKDIELPAFLGNLSGTVKADNAYQVYVTLLNGEVITVHNGKVPNVPRLPVIIGYAPNSSQLEILRARDVFTRPPYPEVPPHATLHTFPGVDTIPIRGEQFLPGLVTPAGGVTVKVYGFIYQLADGWHVVPTQTIDLSSHVPSTGALYVLLQVDDTGTITVTDGTAVDTREELGLDDIPAADADQFVVAAIKLYNSQTNLIFTATDTDIVDLRWGRAGNAAALETYFDTLYVALTGNQTVAGIKTFSSDPIIPDEAYDATAWNGSLEPPTKNAVRDKIESMGAGGGTWGSITGTLSSQTDLQSALDAKEDKTNKATSMTGNTTSNIVYLTAKAIYDWAVGLFSQIGHTHAASDIASGNIDLARLGNVVFLLPFSSYNSLGSLITASPSFPYAATLPSFAVYPKRWSQGVVVGATNNGSNYWKLDLLYSSSGVATVAATVNTSALAAGATAVLTTTTFDLTNYTQGSHIRFAIRATKVGSPSSDLSAHGPALEYGLA